MPNRSSKRPTDPSQLAKLMLDIATAEVVDPLIDPETGKNSANDGFVWVKRKHYFPAELNHRYFARKFGLPKASNGGNNATETN